MNPFKLLAIAIITIGVLGALFSLAAPEIGREGASEKARSLLESAQLNRGKLVYGGNVEIHGGEMFLAENLETGTRVVIFECTSPLLCCTNTDECSSAIEISEKTFAARKPAETGMYARCTYGRAISVCRVFFGEKMPAQIEINEISTGGGLKRVDIAAPNSSLTKISLRNTGDLAALETFEINAFLEKKEERSGTEAWVEVESETIIVEGIETTGEIAQETSFRIPYAGEYRTRARAHSEELGMDEKTFEFEAVGRREECLAAEQGNPFVYPETGAIKGLRGLEVSKAGCMECQTGADCAQAWKSRAPGARVEQASQEYAYIIK